jgi:hypothetical protein
MRRTVPFSAAAWEAARFFLLFLVMTAQLNRQLSGSVSLLLLWVSSVSLAALAALVLAGGFPGRYSVFVPLVAVVKLLQVLFGIILVLYIRGLIPVLLSALGLGTASSVDMSSLSSSLPMISAIVGIDLIALVFLLVYSMREGTYALGAAGSEGAEKAVGADRAEKAAGSEGAAKARESAGGPAGGPVSQETPHPEKRHRRKQGPEERHPEKRQKSRQEKPRTGTQPQEGEPLPEARITEVDEEE